MELIKVVMAMCLAGSATSFKMVKLHNSRSTVTSSTLAWSAMQPSESPVPNAVPIGSGGPAWCRAREHAVWVAGAVVDGRCRLPFLGKVVETDDFQVLVSLNGSARLLTQPWDSLTTFPKNAVSTPNMLLALSNDQEGGAVLPGFVDPKERRAHFLRGDEAIKLDGGLLITEVEPVAYRLSDVRLSPKIKRLLHDSVLQEFVLENPAEEPADVSRELTFRSPHVVYFGRMKGTVVGLPTPVSGPDTFPVNITWGIKNEFHANRTHTVTYNLPAKSSVNVRLIAEIRNLEGAYSGLLTSIYEDGVELQRDIDGLHTEGKLAQLRAEFDQTLSLEDESPIEAMPPQTVVLLHSTTTTPAPVTERGGGAASSDIPPLPQAAGINGASRMAPLWAVASASLSLLLLRLS